MKSNGLKLVIVLLSFLLIPFSFADVFLNGTYIEVGIYTNGAYGSSVSAPAGFHQMGGRSQLGFVADIGKDGWDVGSPAQSGDYFMPGSWEEGFMVEWNTDSEYHYFNAGSTTQIPVTNSLTETSSGTTKSVVWGGQATNGNEKVNVVHTTSFDESDAYFIINTILTNVGSEALNSFEYMRTVDPDNDKDIPTGSYQTRNYIAYIPNSTSNKALVVAKGYTYTNVVIGLGTIDSRARASPIASGIFARDPDYPLDTPRTECTSASPCIADIATPLAFRFGTLYPGQSVSVDYAYILNENDLDTALGDIGAVTILQPTGTVAGSSVNFQATTNNVSGTDSIEFFVNGTSIGIDTIPDFGGNFHTTFDSTSFPAGTLSLKVIANFSGGNSIQKMTTVIVDNTGPPISLDTPISNQNFAGTGIDVNVTGTNASHLPTRVSFFRETDCNGSIFLYEDSSAPFHTAFNVSDLPNGETVVIKAVAFDTDNKMTTASVSGRVYNGASFYNIPSGIIVADSSLDTTLNSGDIFSTEKLVQLKRADKKIVDLKLNFHVGDVDLIHLVLDSADDNFKKINVIDLSSVESIENINQSNHSLYIENEWQNGAYVCPDAKTTDEVNTFCTSKTSFTHPECASGTEKSSISCTIDDIYYKLNGLEGTGVGANGNAQLVISDSAEGSSAHLGVDINFFANYTNATSGVHISGASCNITFDDNLSTSFVMNEDTINDKYNYTKSGGFSIVGNHDWSVLCSATNFNYVNTTDNVNVITPSVPEFSDYAIFLILIITIGGFFVIKHKKY
ncbi:MAG: hypothetical protein ABH824_02545 [Nanoarchaeota archaeon]|nr:hypothetical protein [Nanoarchaeota archaeon]MBU1632648.1 hypothetical protein [Nanoarchaeota archaeon]MBU1876127.1 hypothetical protein [Nanoarchaeota archaeon]